MPIQSVKNELCNAHIKQSAFGRKIEGNVSTEEFPDYYVKTAEVSPTKRKKIRNGILSVIPGLGQFVNGDNKKGFALLATGIATLLGFLGFHKLSTGKDMWTIAFDDSNTLKRYNILKYIAGALFVATVVTSIVDAVKNTKSYVKNVEYKK